MDIWVKNPEKKKKNLMSTFFNNIARYLFSTYDLFKFHHLFMPKDEVCPFCSKDVLKKQLVLEGKTLSALYCLTPATTGNVLVIPKRHLTRFEDLSYTETGELQVIISKIADAFKNVYKIEHYLIIQKNGVLAGQSVKHIHFHIIPCPVDAHRIIDTAFDYRNPINNSEMLRRTQELQTYFQSEEKKIQMRPTIKKPRSRLARAFRFPALRKLAHRSRHKRRT